MAVPLFLVISSFLRFKKYETNNCTKPFLSPNSYLKSCLDILFPYLFIVVFEIIVYCSLYFSKTSSTFRFESIKSFVLFVATGGAGPGSYYIPILLQLVFLHPVICYVFKKNKEMGLIMSLCLNIVYELMVYYSHMSPVIYRLLIFRYLFIIGVGAYLVKATSNHCFKNNVFASLMLVIGFSLLFINTYVYEFPLFQDWKVTSLICGFYVYGIFYFLSFIKSCKRSFLCDIGSATYHIFLIQKVWYAFGYTFFNTTALGKNIFLLMLIGVLICVFDGYFYHVFETKVRRKLYIVMHLS